MNIRFKSLNDAVRGTTLTTELKIAVLMATYNFYRMTGDPDLDTGTFEIDGRHFVWRLEAIEIHNGNRVTRVCQITLAEELQSGE